jgi:hypothetical protein
LIFNPRSGRATTIDLEAAHQQLEPLMVAHRDRVMTEPRLGQNPNPPSVAEFEWPGRRLPEACGSKT